MWLALAVVMDSSLLSINLFVLFIIICLGPDLLHLGTQGICTFVDHSTREKLSFAYSRDYRVIPRPQHSPNATPKKTLPFSSPFSKHSRRRSTSFSVDNFKTPAPFRTKAGYKLTFIKYFAQFNGCSAMRMFAFTRTSLWCCLINLTV